MAETDFAEIERLNEKWKRDPKSRIFAQLGDAYRKAGMIEEAFEVLKRGLEVHPNYATAHLVLARCYLDKRMGEMAKDVLMKLITLDPQSLVGFKLLAQTCEKLGDEKGMITSYKGITGLDPSDAQARQRLEELLKKKTSEDIGSSMTLAREYENQGHVEKALEIYKKLAFQEPGDIELQRKVEELSKQVVQEEKTAKLPPLEEILPETPPPAVEPKVQAPEPQAQVQQKPVEAKPEVAPEEKPEDVAPGEELQEILQEATSQSQIELEKPGEPTESTPLDTLLTESAPAAAEVKAPPEPVEEELPTLDEFAIPAEEKPVSKETVEEEEISSIDSLIKEEEPETIPEEKVPEIKPDEIDKPKAPTEEKPADHPKGDDFQSFQDWLSGLLK